MQFKKICIYTKCTSLYYMLIVIWKHNLLVVLFKTKLYLNRNIDMNQKSKMNLIFGSPELFLTITCSGL